MLKKIILTLAGVLVVVGVLGGTKVLQIRSMMAMYAAMVPPPEVVTAMPVREQQWEEVLRATGSLVAVQGVTVAAEMAGKVVSINFEPGASVAAGDLLVQLDIASEQAQLRAAESQAKLATIELTRSRDLLQKGGNSRAEFDAAEAKASQASAQVDTIKALIAKKTIRAPFAGRLGLRHVNLGQVLRDGDAITTLQTLDPIYVNFSLPQQRLPLVSTGNGVRVTTDAAPNQTFEGRIGAITPEIDPVTRSVRIQATLANPAGALRPGMYANVDVVLPTRLNVLAIPSTAVQYAPFGDSVFLVENRAGPNGAPAQDRVRTQAVKLGQRRGDFVAVLSGLKAGDMVVTAGGFKLAPDMAVRIDNTMAPEPKLAPTPGNE